jgi:hypothetical protein
MTDHPILFNAAMVRAILAGRQTMTRRIIKDGVPPKPSHDDVYPPNRLTARTAPYLDAYCGGEKTPHNPRGMTREWCWWTRDDRPGAPFRVPCVPGDTLWVRETWAHDARDLDTCRRGVESDGPSYGPYYRATCLTSDVQQLRWRPSTNMPRWASRISLRVTAVRVERLRDINEDDAKAEGATERAAGWSMDWSNGGKPVSDHEIALRSARWAFASYWNSINGPDAWDANPWVSVTTFEGIEG